ncbi:hypothetical protein LOKG_00028 [Loktanella phage pCB2051-A]|jgi:hypothetical protein|uniref:Uncharacterized protein n=1 Tax=Loktanella phage pCB2051-A TaxID=754044 RepID=M4QPA2_9CAUD|nr:hypothetical protein LOKG_00028 [Loktanella phage pCB2051-A]AGH31465.1 hypothetical protein LOKG_00028 [Loktanella phage pCB2051-A]
MTRFRDKMRIGRRILHQKMGDPAFYFPWPLNGAEPVPCRVRVHERFGVLGDQKGTSFNYAETADNSPAAIFQIDEIVPRRGFCFTIPEGTAYRVDSVDPPDDQTIKAYIVRLNEADSTGMPVPPEDP